MNNYLLYWSISNETHEYSEVIFANFPLKNLIINFFSINYVVLFLLSGNEETEENKNVEDLLKEVLGITSWTSIPFKQNPSGCGVIF